MRKIFILVFFLLQVIGIIYSRFTELRYFCWAPYDQLTRYLISVEINGNPLELEKVAERYRISNPGRENRAIENIFSIIKIYETRNLNSDSIQVKVNYSINGKEDEIWRFPGK